MNYEKGMMRTEQVIKRKDGITYTRNIKPTKNNAVLFIRISEDILNELKKVAAEKNMSYSRVARNILTDYLSKNN